jgi:hypothetical protein
VKLEQTIQTIVFSYMLKVKKIRNKIINLKKEQGLTVQDDIGFDKSSKLMFVKNLTKKLKFNLHSLKKEKNFIAIFNLNKNLFDEEDDEEKEKMSKQTYIKLLF